MTTFGSTPLSSTTVGSNQVPVSAVAVPGDANGILTALEGGPASTDTNNNRTAPASMYVKDGAHVTLGSISDAAWSGTGNGTEIAILKSVATSATNIPAKSSSSATLSQVSASASSVTLLASNTSRKGAYIYNNGSSNLYVALASTSSTSAFTIKLPPGAYYELPTRPIWTGAVSGIWDATGGSAQITEVA